LAGALEQEQPEGREQVDTWHDPESSAPLQSAENAEDEEDLRVPGNLMERERLMFQTTQADEERGAVRVIKCKLCPKPRFSSWVTFQRHCKSCEKHPSELRFCPKCGDYFGRPDSGVRHNDKKHQEACLNMSQDEAMRKGRKLNGSSRLLKLEKGIQNGGDLDGRRLMGRRTVLPMPLCIPFFLPFADPTAYACCRATDDGIVSSHIYILFLFLPGVVLLYIFYCRCSPIGYLLISYRIWPSFPIRVIVVDGRGE